jgi:hypothetical protein
MVADNLECNRRSIAMIGVKRRVATQIAAAGEGAETQSRRTGGSPVIRRGSRVFHDRCATKEAKHPALL